MRPSRRFESNSDPAVAIGSPRFPPCSSHAMPLSLSTHVLVFRRARLGVPLAAFCCGCSNYSLSEGGQAPALHAGRPAVLLDERRKPQAQCSTFAGAKQPHPCSRLHSQVLFRSKHGDGLQAVDLARCAVAAACPGVQTLGSGHAVALESMTGLRLHSDNKSASKRVSLGVPKLVRQPVNAVWKQQSHLAPEAISNMVTLRAADGCVTMASPSRALSPSCWRAL